jgi:hypothetical protein
MVTHDPYSNTASASRRDRLSRLNTRPARTSINASTLLLRETPHTSGPPRVANPSAYDSFIHNTLSVYLGAQGLTEQKYTKPPPLIRQNATGIRDFLPHRFAKVLTSAALTETHVLLEIFVCKSLLQKPIFLRELLRQDRSKVVKTGYAQVSTLDQKLDLQI